MNVWVFALLWMLSPPVTDPGFFSHSSPQCLVRSAMQGNVLPILVKTTAPACPWTVEDAAVVEVSKYYSRYSWWNHDRSTNLELAGAAVDGTMLMPGEEFRFNQAVGERTEEAGYQRAKVIVSSGYKEDIGGGICQTASMIHAASVLAGLEITRRTPHRFRVGYLPPGLDATVDWGKKDLHVRNNTLLPVVFKLGKVGKGEFVVRVMAPMASFKIRYKYEVVEETPSDRVKFELEDSKDRVKYYGRPGYHIRRWLHRKNMLTGKRDVIEWEADEYSPSPWTLRVAEYPNGEKRLRGVSVEKINEFLKGTKYTVKSARYTDVDEESGEYMPRPYVPRRKMKHFKGFAQILNPNPPQRITSR